MYLAGLPKEGTILGLTRQYDRASISQKQRAQVIADRYDSHELLHIWRSRWYVVPVQKVQNNESQLRQMLTRCFPYHARIPVQLARQAFRFASRYDPCPADG